MALYLKAFPSIDIYTLPAFHINQFKSAQTFNLHILVFFQRFFNQLEKLFHKTIGILLAHAMLFSQQINQILYV